MPTINILLKSDFRDYYDHWFTGSWEKPCHAFNRNTTDGMDRPAMLTFMGEIGLVVPLHGLVKDLYPLLIAKNAAGDPITIEMYSKSIQDVVVYTDIHAHAGNGKIRVSLYDAMRLYPDHYASEYIPALPTGLGQSLRYLRIGTRQFWLRYTSHDDWRSNCGDVSIEVLCEEKPRLPGTFKDKIPHPLYAVDFIMGKALYAIDFNIAPGLKGSGIEHFIKSHEVYNEISQWLSRHEG